MKRFFGECLIASGQMLFPVAKTVGTHLILVGNEMVFKADLGV